MRLQVAGVLGLAAAAVALVGLAVARESLVGARALWADVGVIWDELSAKTCAR